MSDQFNPKESASGETSSRRDFLKTAGVAAAAAATASVARSAAAAPAKSSIYSLAAAKVIGANDRINIGHIGIGGQGNAHLRTLVGSRQDLNHMSIAVCDVYDARREGARKFINAPADKAYRHHHDLLNDKDVDVVWIAVPEHWHFKIAMDTLQSGRDMYLEKPMARYLDEAVAFYKAVKASDRIVQIGAQFTSDSKWHTAGQAVKEGKIGQVVWAQSSYCRNSKEGEWNYHIDEGAGPDNIDWATWLGPAPKRAWDPQRFFRWRKYWDYSSGIINDLFPHRLFPFLIAVGGAEWPKRVTCTGGIYASPDREVADTTIMTVDYPSGHTIVVAGSTVNQVGLEDMARGHKATIYFGGNGVEIRPEQAFSDEVEAETLPLIQTEDIQPVGENIDFHERNFLRCVRSRKQPNCSVDLAGPGQVALCLAEMAYKTNKQMQFDGAKLAVIK
jgi:predicted dehydrogenase